MSVTSHIVLRLRPAFSAVELAVVEALVEAPKVWEDGTPQNMLLCALPDIRPIRMYYWLTLPFCIRFAPQDVLPRNLQGIGVHAARSVASHPPQHKAPKAGAFKQQTAAPSIFRTMYERGDLPVRVNGGVHKFVRWIIRDAPAPASRAPVNFSSAGGPEYEEAKVRFLTALDYSVMLPLFFDGLREKTEPCRFLASAGLAELLAHGDAVRVGPVLPLLVLPLRQALNTREPETIRRTITAIQQLVKVPGIDPASGQTVGELLGPYYRHILPVFNLFKSRAHVNSSKGDYSQSLGEVMDDTMALMAATGGPAATQEIHRLVPCWQPPPPPPRPPTAAQASRVLAQAGANKPLLAISAA